MSLSEDFQKAHGVAVPKGWEPYLETVGDQVGSAIVSLPTPNNSERDLLLSAGFNPDEWRIDGPINTRKWMKHSGDYLYYYKFNTVAGESTESKNADISQLVDYLRDQYTPVDLSKQTQGDCFVFLMSDLQIGKKLGDIGTPEIVQRYKTCVDRSVQRINHLKSQGRSLRHGAIIGLGDIVESCFGHYSNQAFNIDLNQRDQNRIARELLRYTIDAFTPQFDQLTVATIGGNHGERRNDGKTITDTADNIDVEVFEATKEAYDMAGIELDWHIPQGELSMALNLGGVNVGITHGHLGRKGATAQAKAVEWFKGQVFGMQAVQNCSILFSGHYHHFLVTQSGKRWLFQAPAMEAGSAWYSMGTGEESEPGVLTMVLDSNHLNGWDDLKIITA